jgi:predicted MFS family arabinose efflux permease
MVFLVSVVLFHFGNAAMLPMAGQVLAKAHPDADIIALSACIITAQLVMIGVAAAVGWAMRKGVGRKTIFLVAFVTLPIRGFLFTLTDSPFGVVAIQLLDGVAAGIFGVISIIIAADLMRGTGRFNLAQGLVALSTGLGAGASNLLSGFVVQISGYTTGFITLAAIALGGLIFFALMMPETKPEESLRLEPPQGDISTPKPA